ncbi:MAG: sortase [Lachnospiraceae bacterium]|nr:sortase [Lachnospiraceae bacterium]
MMRKAGKVLMLFGCMLLLGALALLAYNQWEAGEAEAALQDAQEKLESAMADFVPGNTVPVSTALDVEPEAGWMSVIEIDGYEYIGYLSIPRYGLELPVMSKWSYAGLKIAPGRYEGSVWTDDLIICAHNYERHFGNLINLTEGDEVTFTDVDGNVFCYEVVEVERLQPTAIEEMESGDWALTLFTCTIGGQSRVTVRCARTDGQTD